MLSLTAAILPGRHKNQMSGSADFGGRGAGIVGWRGGDVGTPIQRLVRRAD